MSQGTPLPIKISKIVRYEDQPRVYFSATSISDLADSIQEYGQQQPIKVIKHPTIPGMFMLVDGERRLRAHKLIQERTGNEPTIFAYIEIITDFETHFKKSFIANLLREDLYPVDEAASIAKLRKTMTIQEIATMIGKSVAYVDGFLKLHTLPDEVKAMMNPDLPKKDLLSQTHAIDIARATKRDDLRIKLAKDAVAKNLSISDTRYMISELGAVYRYTENSVIAKLSAAEHRVQEKAITAAADYNQIKSKVKSLHRTTTSANRLIKELQSIPYSTISMHLDDYDERMAQVKKDLEKIALNCMGIIKRMDQ